MLLKDGLVTQLGELFIVEMEQPRVCFLQGCTAGGGIKAMQPARARGHEFRQSHHVRPNLLVSTSPPCNRIAESCAMPSSIAEPSTIDSIPLT